MKISWIEKNSNMEVLSMIDELRQIVKMMELRKTKIFGHDMRHTFMINIMKGKIN